MKRKNNSQQTIEKIIEVSAKLFAEKGYEKTTTQDIVNALGMSKGAIFHHFRSKEEIVEAVIAEYIERLLEPAKNIALDQSIPVSDRLVKTALSLQVRDEKLASHIHGAGNALMHFKMEEIMLQSIVPLLSDIVREGAAQGLYDTLYPQEAAEMLLRYSDAVFNDGRMKDLSTEESAYKVTAFIDAAERLIGAGKGSLCGLKQLFEGGENV